MSRFLTPFKIGLLAIISIYAERKVPTAAAVPVLSLLIRHVLPFNSKDSASPEEIDVLTIHELQDKLVNQPSGVPGRTLWDWVLKKLWETDSLDSLHVFFDSTRGLLAKTREELLKEREAGSEQQAGQIRLSRTSPLGIFVRRSQVEFTRLQFDDCIALWKSFANYREPTRTIWRRRNPDVARTGLDANLMSTGNEVVHQVLYREASNSVKILSSSNDDFEALLEFQIEQMQSEFGLELPRSRVLNEARDEP